MKLSKPDFQRDLAEATESELRKKAAKEDRDAELRVRIPGGKFALSDSGAKAEAIAFCRNMRRDSFETRLLNIAVAAGFPPHVSGSRFFIDAIKAVVSRPSRIENPKKLLYPAVAKRNFTRAFRVERALDACAKTFYEKDRVRGFNFALRAEYFGPEDDPTAAELVAAAADALVKEFGDMRF